MNLLEKGYKVIYDDQALAFTEAPIDSAGPDAAALPVVIRHLQAVFKHARLRARTGDGTVRSAQYLVFQIRAFPLVSPFIDMMFVAGVIHYFIDRHYHPDDR